MISGALPPAASDIAFCVNAAQAIAGRHASSCDPAPRIWDFPPRYCSALRAGRLFAMSVPAFSPKTMADQHPLQ
jgi:hypothetical protein